MMGRDTSAYHHQGSDTKAHLYIGHSCCEVFPLHGSGACDLLSNRTGIPVKGARVLILEWPKLTGARMQHDVGAGFKVSLPMFSGRNDDWPGVAGEVRN